jgi:hypothetical protein
MVRRARSEIHGAHIDTRYRLVVPIALLRGVTWASEITPNAAVTFELMDDEGFVRIHAGGEYDRALAAVEAADEPDMLTALEQTLIPHAFDKETRLSSIPARVVLHLLERRDPPGGVYVRIWRDCIELWSQDRALRELRNARIVARARLTDWA